MKPSIKSYKSLLFRLANAGVVLLLAGWIILPTHELLAGNQKNSMEIISKGPYPIKESQQYITDDKAILEIDVNVTPPGKIPDQVNPISFSTQGGSTLSISLKDIEMKVENRTVGSSKKVEPFLKVIIANLKELTPGTYTITARPIWHSSKTIKGKDFSIQVRRQTANFINNPTAITFALNKNAAPIIKIVSNSNIGPVNVFQKGQFLDKQGFSLPASLKTQTLSIPFVAEKTDFPIPIHVEGNLEPGEYSGTLTLAAPQLTSPVDVGVTVHVKPPYGWLLGAIFSGIILGTFVSRFLEARNARDQSRIGALEVLGDLKRMFAVQTDINLRAKLEELLNDFEGQIGVIDDPDRITTLASQTKDAFEKILKDAASDRIAIQKVATNIQTDLGGEMGLQGQVAEFVKKIGTQIDRIFGELDRLMIEIPKKQIQELENGLSIHLAGATEVRLGRIKASLSTVLSWPDLHDNLAGLTAPLLEKAQTFNIDESPGVLLMNIRSLEGDLRNLAYGTVAPLLVIYWQKILTGLLSLGHQHEIAQEKVEKALVTIDQLIAERADPIKVIEGMHIFEQALIRIVTKFVNNKTRDGIESLLAERRFLKALTKLNQVNEIGGTHTAMAAADPKEFISAIQIPHLLEGTANEETGSDRRASSWALQQIPDEPLALRELTIRLSRTDGQSSIGHWVISGGPYKIHAETPDGIVFVPLQATRYIVVCSVRNVGGHEVDVIKKAIEVHPARTTIWRKQLKNIVKTRKFLIFLVSSILTLGFGYLMFGPNFTGSFRDMFIAFMWGFTVDVSLQHVRSLGTKYVKEPASI